MKINSRISDEELEAMILHKFMIRGAWHDYHIYESDIPKGFPPNIRNRMSNLAKELKRRGFLISFPHGREHVWVLNKGKSEQILEKVKRYFPEYNP